MPPSDTNTAARPNSTGITLDDYADDSRWVAWRQDWKVNEDGTRTKTKVLTLLCGDKAVGKSSVGLPFLRLMPKIILNASRIVAGIGKGVAASVPEHVAMHGEAYLGLGR
jgi:hypothetical protein